MRSRSRSPRYRNGESSRCHCSYSHRKLHNPGPESPLPDRIMQKKIVINPHGVRPEKNTGPVDDLQIYRRSGEGKTRIFSFLQPSIPLVVIELPGGETASSSRTRDERRPYRREERRDDRREERRDDRREDRRDDRREERRDDRREERRDDRREERRDDRREERRDDRREERRDDRREERRDDRRDNKIIKTEVAVPQPETREISENGGPSQNQGRPNVLWVGGPIRRPRPHFAPYPLPYPPPMGPPPFHPYAYPPRPFGPRPRF